MATVTFELEQETTSELQQFAEEFGLTIVEFISTLVRRTRDFRVREEKEFVPTPYFQLFAEAISPQTDENDSNGTQN
ncbi:MAG: hypothetical protein FWG65_02595 [Turicibacter sp.]|nr:hypothetical protein [Turicibacter sp.]